MQVILEDDLVDSCKSGKNEMLLVYIVGPQVLIGLPSWQRIHLPMQEMCV